MKEKTTKIKRVHFFGEMDLNIFDHPDEVYKKAFHISESCGYFIDWLRNRQETIISLFGRDGERFKIVYNNETNEFKKIIDGSNQTENPKEYTKDNMPDKNVFGYTGFFYL